jgi:GT2 family glycosyltransferase
MIDMRDSAAAPLVSFLIATHNRRDVLLHTLAQVDRCGLPHDAFETLVLDNASTDGTDFAIQEQFPNVVLLRQPTNRGPCAKNEALKLARGEFVVFLDDDSFPQPRSVARMIERFRSDPHLGAAVFTITLPDGLRECSAYPDVCIGCGTGFRRNALQQVGGLPPDFFMAAEEYDLSLRLLDAGWAIRSFDDLHVTHLKTPGSRFPRRITRLDARNNTLLALRYFPDPWRMIYAEEWLLRYRLMAGVRGHRLAFWRGATAGLALGVAAEHRPIRRAAFEQFARIDQTRARLQEAARSLNLRDVLFIDYGKNLPAYRLAAEACGLRVVAIADAHLGGRGLRFRGIPILSDADARPLSFDAALISNLSPVHAAQRRQRWRATIPSRPVLDLFEDRAPEIEAISLAA